MDHIGRYRIVRELGRGAMGVVYLATDPNIGRQVALKTIRLGEVTNPQERARLRERLFREARSAGMLSHPGIVTIYDVEQDGDLAYIAMEYVNGPTLDQLLSEKPLEPERIFHILGQTAVALDYAHQKGTVHRDIKPANIMIAEDGSARITDFGIAKITTSEQFTMTGTIVGTPHYMSPEQVQGQPIDGRTDQFSLAVIAYEMLTGEKPFTGDHLTTVVFRIVAEEPTPPLRLNPSLSPEIESVVRRGLAKKPDARYLSCQEFVNALEAGCKGRPGWKPMARGGVLNLSTVDDSKVAAAAAAPSARRRLDDTTVEKRRRGRLLPLVFGVVMAAVLVGLVAWQAMPWLGGSRQQPASESAQSPGSTSETAAEKKPSSLGPPPPEAKPGAAAPTQTAPAQEPPAPVQAKPAPAESEKPSAEQPPPETKPAPAPARETPTLEAPGDRTAPRAPSTRSDASPYTTIAVDTNPPGATAMLDNRRDVACTTPCLLESTPGRHTVSISRPGHQTEHRVVTVAGSAIELPLINLRSAAGTLMLSTAPPGASIYINGQLRPEKTPAQLNLPPGRYSVTVERDGKRETQQIEIRGGMQVVRIPLAP